MTKEEIKEYEELKREFKDDPDLEAILNGFLWDCMENENDERKTVGKHKTMLVK